MDPLSIPGYLVASAAALDPIAALGFGVVAATVASLVASGLHDFGPVGRFLIYLLVLVLSLAILIGVTRLNPTFFDWGMLLRSQQVR